MYQFTADEIRSNTVDQYMNNECLLAYYEKHRTVKRDQIFMSLPCPLSLTNSRNSCGLRVLFMSLAWTTLETWSQLNIFFPCKNIKLAPNFWHHYLEENKKRSF